MSDAENTTIPVFYDGPIIRVPCWEAAWDEFLADYMELPHEWGVADCVHFAMNNVGVLIGADLTSKHLRQYETQLGAYKYLKKIGYPSIADLVSSFLPEVPIGMVQRGDIVLFEDCTGVCYGAVSLFMGEAGFERVATPVCTKAWKVG